MVIILVIMFAINVFLTLLSYSTFCKVSEIILDKDSKFFVKIISIVFYIGLIICNIGIWTSFIDLSKLI